MKINEILFEGHKKIDLDWVRENCSQAIERYNKGYKMYRGDQLFEGKAVLMTARNKSREAAHAMSNLHTNIINNSSEFKNFPKREIVMSTFPEKAKNYGSLYVCLPVNGAMIGIVPDDDVFTGFKDIKGSLGIFYRRLENEFLPYLEQWTRENFWSVRSTNKLFRELHQNASQQDIEDLVEALEDILANDILYPYKQALADCVKQGSGKPLFALFTNEGWESVAISQFETQGNHEVWTDSPVVLLNHEDIDLVVSAST